MFRLESVWPEWHIVEQLGQGSSGSVYMARRETMGRTFYSAVKIIKIPQEPTEAENLRGMGLDEGSVRKYFAKKARDIVDEISAMEALKSAQNIVMIEDYALIEQPESDEWLIAIRMEILESLAKYVRRTGTPDVNETVRIGVDISSALVCCEMARILHRDIKPENIFRTPFGQYRLGDFGFSREINETSSSVYSTKGTSAYMAPEVVRGGKIRDQHRYLFPWSGSLPLPEPSAHAIPSVIS